MNKTVKKLLSAVLSLALVSGSVVIPITANAEEFTPLVAGDTVLKEWKFDFGAADSTPEDGYTLVTPDRNYIKTKDYGFIGIDKDAYKLGDRLDSFGSQKGQEIALTAGGGTGLNDAIGASGADEYGNEYDLYYPVRFALAAPDDTYYRVKATVTTLDPTADASVTVYTERKHPIISQKAVAAGATETVEFTVRPTAIYYQKSTPNGAIADGMVNICVLGDNSALAALEIQQVETATTFWVLGDSTVTDGNCALPFFPLQNYTGVGTGLTKYLPRTMAMVNEGEGGLNAADSLHWDMVAKRIKAGDYLYLEYGHNHKDDGLTGYVANLDKYYNKCHEVGAKLIIVSPIERINQWDATNKVYTQSLNGFADAGEKYVADKVAAGATDIAYVDLNDFAINFYNKVTADNNSDPNAIKFYFQTAKGGGTDTTHPNDAGAENLAYEFFKAAQAVTDETQKAVLADMLDGMTSETPNLVSAEVMAGGLAGKAWPLYIVPSDNKYPIVIKDIKTDESGTVNYAKVLVQDSVLNFGTYGIIVITVKDADGNEKGKIYAVDQVDNSTGKGIQEIVNFTKDVTIGEGDTYSAVVLQADDTEEGLKVTENGIVYSAEYTPTDIDTQLLMNEDNDGNEAFNYSAATYDGATTQLNGLNGWEQGGSAGITSYLNQTDAEVKYVEMASDGAKNGAANQGSFSFYKSLSETIGTTGRYMISADVQYVSGGGISFNFSHGTSSKNVWGDANVEAFTIGNGGNVTTAGQAAGQISATELTSVKYVLDMDMGTGTLTVGGNDPVTVNLSNYQTTELTVSPAELNSFRFGGDKTAFDVKVANLTVAKLKDVKLPSYDVTVTSFDEEKGTVTLSTPTPEPTPEPAEPETPDTPSQASLLEENDAVVTVAYALGKAIVTSDKAASVVLIEAVYNDDGSFASVKLNPVEFTEAGTKEVEAAEGNTLMLWDSVDGMKPLMEKMTATEPTPPPQTESANYPLNTVVTAKATAADGYVFRGWIPATSSSAKPISMDEEYTFRVRGKTDLAAKFVKEPTLADITSFELEATEAGIKAGVGATTAISVVNATDAQGTPMDKVTNADMTWLCDETGVTVDANGVVTLGEEFTLGDAATKTVKVSATINDVTKVFEITVYGYEYFEDMAEGTTNYTGKFMTIAGKTAIVFPGASTSKMYTMSAPVALDTKTTIKFDNAWSGKNTCGQSRTLNFKNSSDATIFSMYYSWGSLYVNGVEMTGAVAKDTYSTITVEVDPDTKVVTVTVNGTSQATTLADNAGDIAGIEFNSAGSVPAPEDRALGISNIVISK